MRILMVSHGYPPIISGVTLVVQKIARAMVERGHDVTVVAASDRMDPYRDQDDGVQVVRLRSASNPFWDEGPIPFAGRAELEEITAEVRPEIFHVHEAAVLAIQILRLQSNLNLPVMATCYYVPRFVARYLTWNDEPREIVESLFWAYSTWLFGRFDHVVFATRSHLESFRHQGLQVPTTIISNGVDTTRYCPVRNQEEEVEGRYRLPDGPRILFVGRLARDKEIDILMQAMPHICAEHEAHLLVVGRGDDRSRLEKLTEEYGLYHCVRFLGFVPEEDMPALYRAVDLFAIASICEVQSLPTLQAAATGLPVVAVNAMALPELVHDGVNGFLVPPGDPRAIANAILPILSDAEMAERFGQASLEISRPHMETNTFDQYENLYRQMLA